MSEKRGYTKIEAIGEAILEMLAEGKTQREVAEHFKFRNKNVVKDFVKRHNRKQKKMAAGLFPHSKGRPRKNTPSADSEREKDYEIQRLKMENELLRDFLRAAGRK